MSGYECGQVRDVAGRPPTGWYRVHRAGFDKGARFFCRIECLAAWATEHAEPADPADVERTARDLAAAGGRPWLRLRDLTPARLRRLMEAVAEQAAADAAGERYDLTDAHRILTGEPA